MTSHNVVPRDGCCAWQRLADRAIRFTNGSLSNDHAMCQLCCAEQLKLHLTCSQLIKLSNGLIGKN